MHNLTAIQVKNAQPKERRYKLNDAEQLTALYGIPVNGADMEILMRHRAVLFGLLGAFLVYAAFRPSLQWLAMGAGMVSAASFLVIAWWVGEYNTALANVVLADIVAVLALVVAAALRLTKPQ